MRRLDVAADLLDASAEGRIHFVAPGRGAVSINPTKLATLRGAGESRWGTHLPSSAGAAAVPQVFSEPGPAAAPEPDPTRPANMCAVSSCAVSMLHHAAKKLARRGRKEVRGVAHGPGVPWAAAMPLPVADECPLIPLHTAPSPSLSPGDDPAPSLVARGPRRRWARGLRRGTPVGAADPI